jgi:hypothetical protein
MMKIWTTFSLDPKTETCFATPRQVRNYVWSLMLTNPYAVARRDKRTQDRGGQKTGDYRQAISLGCGYGYPNLRMICSNQGRGFCWCFGVTLLKIGGRSN